MTIRCAIYTRKSSEEGLEQQFNSLDNQRLAGENYILSQASEGWEIVEKRYDDGGYSGGNVDRPGLQELLRDIEAGLINCVVVYKIDRLTRSLLDFAKIVELFDKHGVSFVAVTQSFNTSNSMGRLMLHVLLSFAQYERELTGERIRDKIAASKKLGYWLGGYTPFGYDCIDKGLKINESEAKTVRYIFDKFLELKSITATLEDLKQTGVGTRAGCSYSKKTLRQFLENPIYKGFVRHKGTEYQGLHEAIIPEKTFKAVQDIFQKSTADRPYNRSNAILQDIIRCGCCDCAMTPTNCNKNNKKYRYYTCSNHLRKKNCASENKNVPAGEVEEFVTKAVRKLLTNPAITALTVHRLAAEEISLDAAQQALKDIDKVWETLHFQEQQKITKLLIDTVAVDNSGVKILLNHDGAHELIREVTQ
jgi:DNA invertase Pin-like site-specific DNA recombinase